MYVWAGRTDDDDDDNEDNDDDDDDNDDENALEAACVFDNVAVLMVLGTAAKAEKGKVPGRGQIVIAGQ